MGRVREIVLTGGPCAGKTTALKYLREELSRYGFRVFTVPEIATRIITGGVQDIADLAQNNRRLYLRVQEGILQLHLQERKEYKKFAQAFGKQKNEKVIIIYDRGAADSEAYVGREDFLTLLGELGVPILQARDSYDAVFHLVTAANGAEESYSLLTNKARKESKDEAIKLDILTRNAWIGHPHLRVIGSCANFEDKLKKLLREVLHSIGIPEPLEIERKFLVLDTEKALRGLPKNAQAVEIEQCYLIKTSKHPDRRRIRKRSYMGSSRYYLTVKRKVGAGTRYEIEKQITEDEYYRLKIEQDPKTTTIRKVRHYFLWGEEYCELDVFVYPRKGLCVLEIEMMNVNNQFEIPEFLADGIKDVTEDDGYSNYNISLKRK